MIKLTQLLKESEEGREDYPPYMFSPIGFSCAMCEYYYVKDKKHMCGNEEYIEYMGTDELIDPKTGKQIEDPTKWCSNWFEPAKAKDIPELKDKINEKKKVDVTKLKKGDEIDIDMGQGKETVKVMSNFKAGISKFDFVSLKRKAGAPYTITLSRLEKAIV